jgi:hypothetical protein
MGMRLTYYRLWRELGHGTHGVGERLDQLCVQVFKLGVSGALLVGIADMLARLVPLSYLHRATLQHVS